VVVVIDVVVAVPSKVVAVEKVALVEVVEQRL
jgi:hypothetical protein